jgi:flagellar basal-body rod modification protein FlgD
MVDVTTMLNATSSGGTSGGTEKKDLLDQDVFMSMLIEQLKSQDPLNPMDTAQMTSQLASLSSLQELKSVNANLETLQLYESSLNNAQSVALIGKRVKAVGTSLAVPESGPVEVPFYLGQAAAKVTITISDENGKTVKVIELTDQAKGDHGQMWDGTDTTGQRVAPGSYKYAIKAADADGGEIKVDTFIEGIVESIRFEGGIPILMINGHEVSLGDIYEINVADGAGGNG